MLTLVSIEYRSPTLEHSLHKLLLGGEIFLFTTLMWGEEGNIVGIQTRANRVGDCFLIFCWLVISNLCVLYLNIFWWCSCSMELSRKINVLHSDSYKKLLSPNCVSILKHILISKFFGDLHIVGDIEGIDSQIFYKNFVISNLCFVLKHFLISKQISGT